MEILLLIIMYWLTLVNFLKTVLPFMLSTLLLGRIPHRMYFMMEALIQGREFARICYPATVFSQRMEG